MKVKELLEFLQGIDQDLEVLVQGYEGGYGATSGAEEVQMALNVNDDIYCGSHEIFDPTEHSTETCKVAGAVIIW